jgi:hypothetical protein
MLEINVVLSGSLEFAGSEVSDRHAELSDHSNRAKTANLETTPP